MINKNALVKLTQELIRIDSQNPGGNEAEIARFLKQYLAACRIKARIYEFRKKRSNVVAVIKGGESGHSLLLTPHLDTVPKGGNWRYDPFGAKIERGRIYGLGASDDKANVAVSLEVIRSLSEEKIRLDYDLIFAATADEECSSALGLIPLLKKGILKPQEAVVLDSNDFNIIVTQKGLMHLKIKLQGKRAHGAYPWRGENAIWAAARIISELKNKKLSFKKNRYLRPSTVNVGTIRGGDKVNIVADWCEFELDFRFTPGIRAEYFLDLLRSIIKKYTSRFRIEINAIQKPFFIDPAHSLVTQFRRSAKRQGVSCLIKGSEGATVITFFQDKFIPAIATGFGSGGCAHSVNEYVKISNLYRGAKVLECFLKDYKFK